MICGGRIQHWTNKTVYDRLAPGVKKELKRLNPRTEGDIADANASNI